VHVCGEEGEDLADELEVAPEKAMRWFWLVVSAYRKTILMEKEGWVRDDESWFSQCN
jgi:hypothetical protein